MIQLPDVTTVTDAIVTQATAHPDDTVMTFLVAGHDPQLLTVGQLHVDAQIIARRLAAAGIGPGDVVIVAGEHDPRLIVAFLATLYSGATPTIAPYPSAFSQASLYPKRLLDTVKASQARAVIALADAQSVLIEQLADTPCRLFNSDLLTSGQTGNNPVYHPEPSDTAYVQFSSGTTGEPKGAVVNHKAALHHLQILVNVLKLSKTDVLVGWAPFYHDLGLVLYLLLPLVTGIPVVTMAPDYWVRRPHILLRALHDYCGTVALMPGFGFAHTARYVRQRDVEDLDLRCVRLLIAGTEVVQPEVLQGFASRFRDANLAREALQVGYGMAECVFMGSMTAQDRPPRIDRIDRHLLLTNQRAFPSAGDDALPVVSCGTPPNSIKISIRDDDNKLLPERQVGEIVIDSPTLFDRYLCRPELTKQTLRQGQLYTGDLGYLADGELFVIDRKKDLIISAGKHIYPETLEQLALDVVGDAGRRAAAFGVQIPKLGTELPVLVCEVRGKAKDPNVTRLINAIRQQIAEKTNVTLADIRFVRRGWLVKTTSGKVARNATRDKYLAEGHRPDPPALALLRSAGNDPILLEQALTVLAAQVLGVPSVQPEDNFFELGADSFALVRFVLAVEEGYDRQVLTDFFREPTVTHLTQVLKKESVSPQATQPVAANSVRPIKALKRLFVQAWRGAAFSKRFAKRLILRAWRYAFYLSGRCGCGVQYYRYSVRLWRFYYGANSLQRYNKRRQVYLVVQFLEKTGLDEHKPQQIVREILVNRRLRQLTGWGKFPYLPDAQWQQLVFIENQNLLDEALAGRTGVVIVTYHSIWTNLLPRLILMCDVPVALIRRSGRIDLARQLLEAYRVLADGGIVTIAADSTPPGSSSSEVHFFNRICYFPNGFAKLAIATDAVVLSSHIMVTLEGKFHIRLRSLQNPKDVSDLPSERFDRLVENYVQHLQQIWATGPELISTEQIRQYLDVDSIAFVWW